MAQTEQGVSYIVTVFNKAPTIARTLEFIKAQEISAPREIIIVDDCSTDGSAEAISAMTSAWTDTRVIRLDRNSGPSVATNIGFRAAQMPWVFPVDGDDLLAPWATRTLLGVAEGAVGVWGGTAFQASDLQAFQFPPAPAEGPVEHHPFPVKWVLETGHAGSSKYIARRSEVLAVGACDETVFVQDQSLPIRLATRGTIICIDVSVSAEAASRHNRISDSWLQLIHDMTKAQINFLREFRPDDRSLYHLVMTKAAGRAWRAARRAGNFRDSLAALGFRLRALSQWPVPTVREMDLARRIIARSGPVRELPPPPA